MKWSLFALLIGFGIDLIVGDPHGLPHPVVGIGKLISLLERRFRALFPKTARGEIFAGACIWLCTVLVSAGLPALILYGAQRVSVYLRLALESVMCWQVLAVRSLREESMRVYAALQTGSLSAAQQAVSMIVGRDTARLDAAGVELVCLAGYMRIVGDVLLGAYGGRIINIHPSLLPAFRGAHAIEQALEYGVKVFGVTIHYVDAELDGGRIIAQRAFPYEGDDIGELEAMIHAVEYPLYIETIKKLIE